MRFEIGPLVGGPPPAMQGVFAVGLGAENGARAIDPRRGTMVVGVGRLHLRLHDNHSLKGKRKVVRKTIERVRSRFDVAIAEVGDQNLWQSIRLGLSVVGSNRRIVHSVMDRVVDFIEGLHLCEIVDVDVELLHFGEDGY